MLLIYDRAKRSLPSNKIYDADSFSSMSNKTHTCCAKFIIMILAMDVKASFGRESLYFKKNIGKC